MELCPGTLRKQQGLCFINCLFSLLATIQFHRPDLLPGLAASSIQIPLNPPYDFFDSTYLHSVYYISYFLATGGIPGVGQLMLASFPADYQPTEDISADNPWYEDQS